MCLDGFRLFTFLDNVHMRCYLQISVKNLKSKPQQKWKVWQIPVKILGEMNVPFFSLEIVNKSLKTCQIVAVLLGVQTDGKKISMSRFSAYPLRNNFLREDCRLRPSKRKNGQIRWLTQGNYVVSNSFQV